MKYAEFARQRMSTKPSVKKYTLTSLKEIYEIYEEIEARHANKRWSLILGWDGDLIERLMGAFSKTMKNGWDRVYTENAFHMMKRIERKHGIQGNVKLFKRLFENLQVKPSKFPWRAN